MKSIRTKLLVVIISILFSFAAILMLANAFLLDDYYVYKTKSSFIDVSNEVLNEYKSNKKEILVIIREIASQTGYKLVIVNQDYEIRFSSVPEFNSDDQSKSGTYQKAVLEKQSNLPDDSVYYDVTYDESKEESFVTSISKIDKNNYLIITQPLAQISQNAKIANDFFLIIGIIMLIIASFVSLMFAKKLVKPILDITKIAESIAKLDFSNQYNANNKDEIGDLGKSINNISQKLDSTITELKQNNDQLIKEMKLQKRFVASVSHEFNTPVGLIRGYTEALDKRMYGSESERTEIINIIIKEADRLNHLVNDILLVLRFDSKSFKLALRKTDISKLIRDSAVKIAARMDDKNISINNSVDKNILLDIDPVRITQVVDNLLSNALSHVDENGEIRIFAQTYDKYYKFNISNTGSYVSDDDKKHLFEAFYRAENSRNRNSGGNGLGLSIVAGIISAHGGTYGVNDTDNGTNFWFALSKK